jgi:hypothetical protein
MLIPIKIKDSIEIENIEIENPNCHYTLISSCVALFLNC